VPRWKIVRAMWAHRLGFPRRNFEISPEFLEELC
jgi:hypothetical protein